MSIYGALGENIGEQPLDPPEYPEDEDEEEDGDPCEGCFNDCDGCEHKQEMEDLPCDAAIRDEISYRSCLPRQERPQEEEQYQEQYQEQE